MADPLNEPLSEKEVAAITWKAELLVDSMSGTKDPAERAKEVAELVEEFSRMPESIADTVKAHANYLASKFDVGTRATRLIG